MFAQIADNLYVGGNNMAKTEKDIKENPPNFIEWICAIIAGLINFVVKIILLISGIKIVQLYLYLMIWEGSELSRYQQTVLDYSITIFAGGTIFLILHRHQIKEIIKETFNVKPVN